MHTVKVERSLGLTEAAALVSVRRMADEQNTREGYQGRLEPNVEAKIIPSTAMGTVPRT